MTEREEIWKYVGLPTELWPLCELLGLMILPHTERARERATIPKPHQFAMFLPLVSNGDRCAITRFPPEVKEWVSEDWQRAIEELVEHRRLMAEGKVA